MEGDEEYRATGAKTAATQAMEFLEGHLCAWLDGSGPEAEIVITSRVRLARNLRGVRFPGTASAEERAAVRAQVAAAVAKSTALGQGLEIPVDQLSPLDRRFLMERRLISPQLVERTEQAAVFVDSAQSLAVMVNEEDHLRLQAIWSGLRIQQAWETLSGLDDDLAESLDYDFSEQFGYLTACPTNTGTGMRVSIFVHLPGLAIMDEVDKVLKELAGSEITVRGFYGEGSRVQGHIFQVSNQLTLGRAEKTIVKRIQGMAERLVALEREARARLAQERPLRLKDAVYRAWAVLEHAHLLSSLELMNLLSAVRVGSEMGPLPPIPRRTLNELLVVALPAHLQKRAGQQMEGEERDAYRARFVREYLGM